MTRPRALILCPGRGSYGKEDQGWLIRALPPHVRQRIEAEDERRRDRGLPSLLALDQPGTFKPGTHLDGENASPLIYCASLLGILTIFQQVEAVAIAGNSLGWYTALAAADALEFEDGLRLVTTMARLQREHHNGGQLLYSLVDEDWRIDAALREATLGRLAALRAAGEDWHAAESIRLGGHLVIAGTDVALDRLQKELPPRKLGDRSFPFRLAGHGPFHTRLAADVSRRAIQELRDLPVRPPAVPLIDGAGRIHTPWSADPEALRDYTLGRQVTETFDFTLAVRVGLLEFAPDVVIALPPGNSLGAPVGHILVQERWRGIDGKAAFQRLQSDPATRFLQVVGRD
jgi:[acyl-carrier-protein] S-malonyltransferase